MPLSAVPDFARARRELDEHARTVLAHALLDFGEPLGVRRRSPAVVANVNVHDRGAGLVGGVGGLDLLGGRDRYGGIVGFVRYRTGDRDGNDGGVGHGHTLLSRIMSILVTDS